jgi:hypothetical protein
MYIGTQLGQAVDRVMDRKDKPMEAFFVIKVEDGTAYVREATRDYRDGTVNYRHTPETDCLIAKDIGPRFYGKLDILLNRAAHIANAEPIEPQSEYSIADKVRDESLGD